MKKKLEHIKDPGFKAPKEYFKGLEDKIIAQISLEEKISGNSGFKVPEGFFDSFQEKVESRMESKPVKVRLLTDNRKSLFRYTAAAAVVVVLVVSILFFDPADRPAEVPVSSIHSYIEDGYMDISGYEIEEFLSDEALGNELSAMDLSSEELLNYLSQNLDETLLTYEE